MCVFIIYYTILEGGVGNEWGGAELHVHRAIDGHAERVQALQRATTAKRAKQDWWDRHLTMCLDQNGGTVR